MKKLLLAAAMTAVMVSPALAENIGVTMANSDTFLTVLRNGIESYGKEKGIALTIEIADDDVNKQTSQIENFIAAKVDAIIVNAVDTSATPKMTKLLSSRPTKPTPARSRRRKSASCSAARATS